jgi:hypothetical protein
MSKRNHTPKEPRRRGAPKGNRNAFKHGLYSQDYSPVYQEQTGSDGAFKNEIAAFRRIFFDYTLVYDQAQTQEERDRAVQIMSLISLRMAQLGRAQHFITPPEDPQWKALMEANEAVLRDKPIMDLFRPKGDSPPEKDNGGFKPFSLPGSDPPS